MQTPSTPNTFYYFCKPETFYTEHLFTPNNFYTKHLLDRAPTSPYLTIPHRLSDHARFASVTSSPPSSPAISASPAPAYLSVHSNLAPRGKRLNENPSISEMLLGKKGGGIARKTATLPIWLRMRGSLFLALSSLQHKSVHTKEWTKSWQMHKKTQP